LASSTNNGWNLQLMAGTSASGATGTLWVHGAPGLTVDIGAVPGSAASPYTDLNTAVSSTIDLTGVLYVDFTVATSTGNAGNSITQDIAEVLPQGAGGGGGGGSTFAPPYVTSDSVTFYGPIFAQTKPPAIGTLTWANQGGATATDQNGAILMTAPASAGDNIRFLGKAYPTPPFTFTIGVILDSDTLSGTNSMIGIAVTDGTKYQTHALYANNSNVKLFDYNASDANTFVGGMNGIPSGGVPPIIQSQPVYLTFNDDGANFNLYLSYQPLTLGVLIGTSPRTNYLTPTAIGVYINTHPNPIDGIIFHWTGI
ncbi:MAG: hypothetical protein NT045_05485, partial [Candidatus Aureabacteria bacterium]|nr:hypothetical protein [Candidatus Auribacterota bacterium]